MKPLKALEASTHNDGRELRMVQVVLGERREGSAGQSWTLRCVDTGRLYACSRGFRFVRWISRHFVTVYLLNLPSPPDQSLFASDVSPFSRCSPTRSLQIQSISAASLAYAEVLIAEIALRNRERIALILPLLLEHYRRVAIVDVVAFAFAALA